MAVYKLDITKEHCPMTFVKAKIELSKLAKGDRLEIMLKDGEPLENVPKSASEEGFLIIDTINISDNIYKLVIEK